MAGDGTASGFDAALFRQSIEFAMNMGAANDADLVVIFRFDEERTYQQHGPAGNPYDWTSGDVPVTDVPQKDVKVPAAVQWAAAAHADNVVGEFDLTHGTVTILDTYYAQVKDCNEILVGGNHYVIDAPGFMPQGLFDVTVWTCHITARG